MQADGPLHNHPPLTRAFASMGSLAGPLVSAAKSHGLFMEAAQFYCDQGAAERGW